MQGADLMKATFKIEGMDKLIKDIEKLGKVPQSAVTPSAKKGMNTVLKDARANAPYDTGQLKKGIVLSGEKSRYKGKKVYDIVFDDSMNDVFQKPVKNPRSRGGQGSKTAYYPASQEYGYFAGDGNYIPGYRFIHHSLTKNAESAANTMIDTMTKKIEAEARKAGLY
jgi:HK97 gp10 family phage protein